MANKLFLSLAGFIELVGGFHLSNRTSVKKKEDYSEQLTLLLERAEVIGWGLYSVVYGLALADKEIAVKIGYVDQREAALCRDAAKKGWTLPFYGYHEETGSLGRFDTEVCIRHGLHVRREELRQGNTDEELYCTCNFAKDVLIMARGVPVLTSEVTPNIEQVLSTKADAIISHARRKYHFYPELSAPAMHYQGDYFLVDLGDHPPLHEVYHFP